MSKVVMMCGVCGSGKTTYAKQLEKSGFVRLSIDEEMWRVYGQRGLDFPENQYEALSQKTEIALREKMIALINEGRDIVLDFSFWNKKDRDTYRSVIRQAGGTPQLIYMKASKEVLKKRLQKRNQTLNANSPFIITDEILDHRVCQVKCVNFFDFIWRSKTDRHIYTIKSNQMVVLRHCDTLRIRVTYHDL